jgi:hypothetical protein
MGRIRTIKPEWLEDERLLEAGSDSRVMSLALILLADDYGRGRASVRWLAGQVFAFEDESHAKVRETLAALSGWFVETYEIRGQHYFQILNWSKHQRVDKPGKPRVPEPPRETSEKVPETLATDLGPRTPTTTKDPDHASAPESVAVVYRSVSGNTDLPAASVNWTSKQQTAVRTMLGWSRGRAIQHDSRADSVLRGELERLKQDPWIAKQPIHIWAERIGAGGSAPPQGPAVARADTDYDNAEATL